MTKTVIIGGGSGMGLALARTLLAEGVDVTIVGRSADRLESAEGELTWETKGKVTAIAADIGHEEEVAELFAGVGTVDHVAVTAADVSGAYGRTADITAAAARAVVDTKLLGAWLVGKYAAGRVTGSITYTSGINAYRPNGSNTIVAAANGALASLAYGLAVELAPVRVNVISPGWVDTGIWDQLGMDKQAAFAELSERLPTRRIGTPEDLAQAFVSVMRNGYVNGTVLHVDGGHRLV